MNILVLLLVAALVHHFAFAFVSVVLYFSKVGLGLGLYGNEPILNLSENLLFEGNPSFELGDELANLMVLGLVEEGDGLEMVGLMFSKHLALAAG